MEREILFRAKKTNNGEWVEGGFTLDSIGNPRITTVTKDKQGLVFNEVISETVGQFTGLTDKNGTKIFEGDIVNSDYGYGHPACVVELKSIIYAEVECLISDDIEVIGNIYDNKDSSLFEYPKNIYDSLSEQLESGKITLREAAIKLHKAGITPFIDEEYTKQKLL